MSPIYGIVAQDTATVAGSPNTYVANAVTFNGSTSLTKASITSNQFGPFFGVAGAGNIIMFYVSNDGVGSFHNRSIQTSNAAPPGSNTGWTHIIGSFDAQNGIGKMYFDDVNAGGAVTGAVAFNVSTNGLQFLVGGDTFSGDEYIGDMCDLSIWPGVSFLTGNDITLTTRRFFRDSDGKPIDPAIYIAEFGTPPVMLSGNATNFLTNSLGSSGSMSYYAGTLTNAATHP